MAKTNLSGTSNAARLNVAVAAAAGSAGAAIQYSLQTSKITIFNSSAGPNGIEYRIGLSGQWVFVPRQTGAEEYINMASTAVYVRNVASNTENATIEFSAESVLSIDNLTDEAYSLSPRVVRSNIMEEQIYGTVQAQSQTATDFTYHMTIVLPGDFTEVQAVLDNVSLTLPFRIKKAIVATSDSIGPDVVFGATTNQVRFTPQGGQGWKDLTWDNGTANVEIAVTPGSGRKTRKASDSVIAASAVNSDGSLRRVLMLRFLVEGTTNSPGNGYCVGAYPMTWRTLAANTALHKGYLWQCIRYTGDGVTTPANFQPTTDLSALPFLTCVRVKTRVPALQINLLAGDSIPAGAVNGFTGNFGNGWLWQLTNKLRERYPSIPVALSNNGYPSTGTAIYSQNAIDYINAGGPIGLPIYQVASQNDGTPSKANYDVAMARMATVCGLMQAKGKAVALMPPIVNTSLGWNASADGDRLNLRSEILRIQASGQNFVLDMEAVSDGGTPSRYKVESTTDFAHPNEFGAGQIADANFLDICKAVE